MSTEDHKVKIHGVGTHQIDFELIDEETRNLVVDCIRKNGKISLAIGIGRVVDGISSGGFAQQID